jgi:hypothetical protein
MSLSIEYINYTVLFFNNPNHYCLNCNTWAPGFIAGKRKLKLWPCMCRSNFKSACPTWDYTKGCTCTNERHLTNAADALKKINSRK